MQTFYDLFKDFTLPAIIFGLFIELVGGFIFIFSILYILKPNIKIVPFIVVQNNPFDDCEKLCYAFKIINLSFFGAFDLEAKAALYAIKQGHNGIVDKVYTQIELKNGKVNHIPRRRVFDKNRGDHCVQFITYVNLSELMIDDNKQIEFQIIAKHELSGLANIFTHDFVDKSSIKKGKFKSGNCSEVIKS